MPAIVTKETIEGRMRRSIAKCSDGKKKSFTFLEICKDIGISVDNPDGIACIDMFNVFERYGYIKNFPANSLMYTLRVDF